MSTSVDTRPPQPGPLVEARGHPPSPSGTRRQGSSHAPHLAGATRQPSGAPADPRTRTPGSNGTNPAGRSGGREGHPVPSGATPAQRPGAAPQQPGGAGTQQTCPAPKRASGAVSLGRG